VKRVSNEIWLISASGSCLESSSLSEVCRTLQKSEVRARGICGYSDSYLAPLRCHSGPGLLLTEWRHRAARCPATIPLGANLAERVPCQSWPPLLYAAINQLPSSTPLHPSIMSTVPDPTATEAPDAGLNCGSGGGVDTFQGLRIGAIFIILFGSLLGASFPIFAKRSSFLRVPHAVYEYVPGPKCQSPSDVRLYSFAKYFGSGVIVRPASRYPTHFSGLTVVLDILDRHCFHTPASPRTRCVGISMSCSGLGEICTSRITINKIDI
jgi:hypothetical protein